MQGAELRAALGAEVQRAIALELSYWSEAVLQQIRELLQRGGAVDTGAAADTARPASLQNGVVEKHRSPREGAEGSGAGTGWLQDSWKEELRGIRSDLGALRAGLEGRPALEQELQGIRSDVGELRGRLESDQRERQAHMAAVLEHELQEGLQKALSDEGFQRRLEQQGVSVRDLSQGLGRLRTLLPMEPTGVAEASPPRPPHDKEQSEPPDREDPASCHPRRPSPRPALEDSRAAASAPCPEEGRQEPRASKAKLASQLTSRVEKKAHGSSFASSRPSLSDSLPALGLCLGFFENLGASEAPRRSDPLSKFVDSPLFSTMVIAAILVNCVFMVVAADMTIDVAFNDPHRETIEFIDYGELIFLILYTLEFILKLWRYRLHFFCDPSWMYNWLDTLLLIEGYTNLVLQEVVPNFSWIRLVRMLRLAKTLRVFRLMAVVQPLRAVLHALAHTFDKLFWSIVMMTLVLLLFSLLFVIRVASFLEDDGSSDLVMDGGVLVRDALAANYGSVGQTMINMFMVVTGGNNWSMYYLPLVPTGQTNWMLFLFFVAFSQIALLNIILGVFVNAAIKDMDGEKEAEAEAHAEESHQDALKLRNMCYELDEDGDGKLSSAEWHHALRQHRVQYHLEKMSFRIIEVRELLDLMCTQAESDVVPIDTFVDTVIRYRGSSSCYDMQVVIHGIQELKSLHSGGQKGQCTSSI